jgi:endonuclease/exonuclease/phosphatase family metal-dependent hydrolase
MTWTPLAKTGIHLLALALLALWLPGCASWVGLRASPGQAPEASLRVVTYNIANGMMLKPRASAQLRYSREAITVRHALRRHRALSGADIIALQEVCGARDLPTLRSLGPYHVHFDPVHPASHDTCRKGQAVLSRWPILDAGRIQLPRLRRVNRSAMWVDVQVPTPSGPRLVRVYNLHLENRGQTLWVQEGRWRQMQTILAHYQSWRERHPHAAVLMLGDFNSLGNLKWSSRPERTIVELHKHLRSALPLGPSTHVLRYQTDWIFYGALELESAQVVDILLSDHFPVVARFSLPARGTTAQGGHHDPTAPHPHAAEGPSQGPAPGGGAGRPALDRAAVAPPG